MPLQRICEASSRPSRSSPRPSELALAIDAVPVRTSRRPARPTAHWEECPTATESRCGRSRDPVSVPASTRTSRVDPLEGTVNTNALCSGVDVPVFPSRDQDVPVRQFRRGMTLAKSRTGSRPSTILDVARIEQLVGLHGARAARVAPGHQHSVAEVRRSRRCSAASPCESGGVPCSWTRPSTCPPPCRPGCKWWRYRSVVVFVCPPATSTFPFASNVAECT